MVFDLRNINFIELRSRTVFLFLFLLAFVIRAPFFFRDYIDRDESTFILMGQSWVEGHLPYTELWDLKPPMTFLFFAGIIYAFGKSFIAIRVFGTLVVAITSFFTYKIGKEIGGPKLGLCTAIACTALQSLFGSLQGVMSEHLSVAFLMPAIFIILKYNKYYWYGLAGILLGLTVMTKLNLAYAVLILGLFLFYRSFVEKQLKQGFQNLIFLGLGAILVILLTILPYYQNGITALWWQSVILAPLEYAAANRGSLLDVIPTCLIIIGFFLWAWKKKYLDLKNRHVQVLFVTVIGILFSFVRGGKINGHYLIQVYPALLILVGMVLATIPFLKRFKWRPYYLLIFLLVPMESYLEYYALLKHKVVKGTFFNGEGIEVPRFIKDHDLDSSNILFLEYHIGYWLLDKKPLTKISTHPSNICKVEMFPYSGTTRKTAMEEITYLLEDIKPTLVITRDKENIFDKENITENAFTRNYLNQYYRIIKIIDHAEIWQRLE
ncbi:glycosyltransferase [Sediminicola sp. YIK13]|uniref:ArnT family glycosyltransferase n=1 Tax=Sediminicola sp. YIK13 TaxID=1453352 RepID=UPI0007227E01|nr:glycosyltransferase family 39 protein [Sediminicola sp. YIK13]ALM08687.1 glycosyltransferase [Sediminicola sp. YIK13]